MEILRLFARDFDESNGGFTGVIGVKSNVGILFFPFDNRQTYSLWFNSENAELQPAVVSMLRYQTSNRWFRLPVDFGRMEADGTALKCFESMQNAEASAYTNRPQPLLRQKSRKLRNRHSGPRSEDWWKPVWYFDFFVGDGFESGISAEETADKINDLSERLRSLNPDIKIILTGADPSLGSAVRWNEEMVSKCCRKIDIFGIQWLFPGVKGWLRGKGPFETESARDIRRAGSGIENNARGCKTAPDQSIPVR